jgi:purine-binding chemotaxis protein CheW
MSTTTHPNQSSTNDLTIHGGKYLTFRLADEEYGLQVFKVREILGIMDITAVPQMPAYVKGVINLRGKVIPVVDLGTPVGVIVDTVQEVLDIDGGQIEPTPPLGAAVDTTFILGMGKVGQRVKILLDIDQVLSQDEALVAEES